MSASDFYLKCAWRRITLTLKKNEEVEEVIKGEILLRP